MLHAWTGEAEHVPQLRQPDLLATWLRDAPDDANAAVANQCAPVSGPWSWVEPCNGAFAVLDPTLAAARHADAAPLVCMLLSDATVVWTGERTLAHAHAHTAAQWLTFPRGWK